MAVPRSDADVLESFLRKLMRHNDVATAVWMSDIRTTVTAVLAKEFGHDKAVDICQKVDESLVKREDELVVLDQTPAVSVPNDLAERDPGERMPRGIPEHAVLCSRDQAECAPAEHLAHGLIDHSDRPIAEQVQGCQDQNMMRAPGELTEHDPDERMVRGPGEQIEHGLNKQTQSYSGEQVEHGLDEQMQRDIDELVEIVPSEFSERGSHEQMERGSSVHREQSQGERAECALDEAESSGANQQVKTEPDSNGDEDIIVVSVKRGTKRNRKRERERQKKLRRASEAENAANELDWRVVLHDTELESDSSDSDYEPPGGFKRDSTPSLTCEHEAEDPTNAKKPWRCEHCGARFAYKVTLITHIRRRHKKVKQYQCPICQHWFRKKRGCLNHARDMHKAVVKPIWYKSEDGK